MKGVPLLVLVAFIDPFFKNHVEAGKCYACSPKGVLPAKLGIGTCEEFASASANEKKTKFVVDSKTSFSFPLDCSKCLRQTEKDEKDENKVIVRGCGQKGVEFCEGNFCNGPSADNSGFGEKCWACGHLPLEGVKLSNCDSFDRADAQDRKNRFTMDSLAHADVDCKKCVTFTEEGKVIFRSCSLKRGWDVCEGDLCNGAGSLASWASVAFLATAASLLN